MALTLGLTGMDPATETALKAAFAVANQSLGARWSLAAETAADHILVDMDSMYGPMSWLRLHAAGKHVIGLTSAPRTQTEFRLGRPFDAAQLAALLVEVAAREGVSLATSAGAAPVADVAPAVPAQVEAAGPAAVREDAPPAYADASPADAAAADADAAARAVDDDVPSDDAPSGDQQPAADTADAVGTETAGGFASETIETTALPPAASSMAMPEPDAVPPPPAEPERDPVFADWLRAGALPGRFRYRRESGPTLLLDTDAQAWHGPTPLKPIAAYFDGTVRREDFEAVPDAQWAAESAALGAAQPLARLRWLGGLLAGRGQLLPGHDPDARYVLARWPQTEREYPKHFRIATAMMKGPATLAEIAATSGIAEAEVADFVNANLETGFAEPAVEAPPPAPEPAKAGGLLGRLRGR